MSRGIVARPRLTGLLATGAAGLALGAGGAALAADAGAGAGVNEVAPAVVTGRIANTLAHSTGLSVIPTDIQDTPQAIDVIPQEQLKAQGVISLDQALRNVPGITVAIGEGGTLNGDQFKIRGQDAKDDIYVDGLRDFGVYTRDAFDDQEVQVLKGPSSALFGRGSTGGVINTISKTPMMGDFAEVDASMGNGDYYRATADINHAFNDTTAMRVNLMETASHVVDRDYVRSRRWGAAVSVATGLGTDTTIVANYLHQHDNRIPDYGVTIVGPPGSLIALPVTEYGLGVDRSTFLGYSADRDRTTADIFTLKVRHDSGGPVSFTSDTRVGRYQRYFRYTPVDRCDTTASTQNCIGNLFDGNPATTPNAFMGGGGPYIQNAWGAQNISTAKADFNAGGFRNQLVAGFDVSYQSNDKTFQAYALPPGVTAKTAIPRNLLDPSHTAPFTAFLPVGSAVNCVGTAACTTVINGQTLTTTATAATVLYSSGDAADYGVFATDRLWLTPQWSVIGTLRYDWYDASYLTTPVLGQASKLTSDSSFLDPRVSLVFEPTKSQTYYVSWGKSATPQGTSIVGSATAISATTADLAPEMNEAFEAGAKFSLIGGRLGLTASIFDVKKNNAKQVDPATGEVEVQSSQKQEIKGVEFGVTGRITDAWTVQAAYSYLDAKVTDDLTCGGTPVVCLPNPYTIGTPVTYTPKNAASVWTTYKLDPIVRGLEIGGGATYQSKQYLAFRTAGTAPYLTGLTQIAEAPYTLSFDGMIAYETGRYRIALNGYNLSDRLNYSQVFANRAVPAAGRTVVLTVGATF
ncbi:MAG: TonB-dependent receptor [Caulobacteraceae bacterium]